MTITPQQLVDREVYACVSYLVSALAGGYGAAIEHVDAQGRRSTNGSELAILLEQAFELCSPVPDYEEAAIEAGFRVDRNAGCIVKPDGTSFFDDYGTLSPDADDSWRTICEEHNIEPYDREIYEHWIISDWLADKLEAHGEKVDRDFANLTIWARTTTGQAIASDYVIEQICAEMNAAV